MSPRPGRMSLAPPGLVVDHCDVEPTRLIVHAHGASASAACPRCCVASSCVHSRYRRVLDDLPAQGRAVVVRITARRFRCREAACPQRIFTERLQAIADHPHAKRSSRLELVIYHLGLALGGRPGERFARRLAVPVSADTLLRTVRRRTPATVACPRVAGIDDFAWRRNHRYGTIVCDLERRCVVDLLPDRERATTATWLRDHQGIEILTRDRGGGYGEAAREALPQAVQVADRRHLFENASAAFIDVVRGHMREIGQALSTGTIDPALLTHAERLRFEGWQGRHATNEQVLALHDGGATINAIVRGTGIARQTVRRILRGARDDVFRVRASTLDAWVEPLERGWKGGCRSGAALWRMIKAEGFGDSLRVVSEWATRKRRDAAAPSGRPRKAPSAKTLARLLTTQRESGSADAALLVAQATTAAPALLVARDLLDRFHALVRTRKPDLLDGWLEAARNGGLASFANGIAADHAAVRAAVTELWSNGPVEGQVTRLKLVKRQMYGRANLDLLRARLIAG
jgi:transposase